MTVKTLVSGTNIIDFGIKFQFVGHFIKKRDQEFLKLFKTDEEY